MPKATPTPQIFVAKTNDAPVKYYKTRNIQTALEEASDGDTVVLSPGDYTGYEIFIPEDVYLVAKPGAILGYEFDNVKGFTSNIADLNAIAGARQSEDLGGAPGVIYYIRPLNGTAIKNSDPDTTLPIELHRIQDNEDTVVSEGEIQLFYRDKSGNYNSIRELDEDSDGYFAELGREDIDGSLNVLVMDSSKPLTQDNVFDGITLADVQDGRGFVGWVTVTPGYTASQTEGGEYSPNFIELDPNFTIDGELIDVENDPNFEYETKPEPEDGVDVFGADQKVEVDTEVYFGARDNKQYTASWEARYTGRTGEIYKFQLVESVYEAKDGLSSQTLQVVAQAQAFKVDKNGDVSPGEIRLRAVTQNVSGGATVNWSIDDTDPNGLDIPLYDEQGERTATGETVFVRAEDLPQGFETATIRAQATGDVIRDGPVEDEISIARLVDGDPGFTVLLTNSNHTFPTDSNNEITPEDYQNGATSALVFRGTEKFDYDENLSSDGTWRFKEFSEGLNEVTPEGAISVSVDNITQRIVPSDMSFPSAVVNATVEVRYRNNTRSEFSRQISYNKAQSGNDIKRLQLSANSQVFRVLDNGDVDPSEITFLATATNLADKRTDEDLIEWTTEPSYVLGENVTSEDSSKISGDGEEYELSYNDLEETPGKFADQVTVSAELEVGGVTYSDRFTVFRLKEGSDAYVLALTNEAHAISTDKNGNPLANTDPETRLPGAETDIRLFRGINEITGDDSTRFEINAVDDIERVNEDDNGSLVEIDQNKLPYEIQKLATPPEIAVSDVKFNVQGGDVTGSVDIQAYHTPNSEAGEQLVGRKTFNISTASRGNDGIDWLIKPLNGTAIKNSNPDAELEFEARKIVGETSTVLEQVTGNEPDPQIPSSVEDLGIYVRNENRDYIRACNATFDSSTGRFVERQDKTGSDGCHPDQGTPLGPVLGAEQVQGQTTLFLLRSATGKDETTLSDSDVAEVLDEIDVVDVLDGLGGGFITATPGRQINVRQTGSDGTGFVETNPLAVTANFAREGSTSVTDTLQLELAFGFQDVGNGEPEIFLDTAQIPEGDTDIELIELNFEDASSATSTVSSKQSLIDTPFGTGENDTLISGFASVQASFRFTSPDTGQSQLVSETFPVRVEAGPRFFIQPQETGTAIKNSSGVINLRAFQVRPDIKGREELDLYGSDRNYALVDSSDNRVGEETTVNNSEAVQFNQNDINGDLDVLLKRYDGGPQGEVLDSITLVDVTDGTDAVIGNVEANTQSDGSGTLLDLGYAWDPNANEFDPPSSDINSSGTDNFYLVAEFFREGALITKEGQEARAYARLTFNENQGTVSVAEVGSNLSEIDSASITVTSTGGGSRSVSARFAYKSDDPLESNYDVFEQVVVSPGGLDGSNAQFVKVKAPSLTFTESGGTVSPDSITLEAVTENIDRPTLKWREVLGDGTIEDLDSDGQTEYSVSKDDLGDNGRIEIELLEEVSDLTDSVTLVRLKEGSDAITPVLTNPAHTFQADNDGSVDPDEFSTGNNTLFVYEGASLLTFAGVADTFPSIPGKYNVSVTSNGLVSDFAFQDRYGDSNSQFYPDSTYELSNDDGNAFIEILWVLTSGLTEPGGIYKQFLSGSLELEIKVRTNAGETTTLNKTITFAKSVAGRRGRPGRGEQGPPGPGVVYQGEYDSSETYFYVTNDDGDVIRRDAVQGSGGDYYVTDNGSKTNTNNWGDPADGSSDWQAYGKQFDSVATGLLLTQDATITRTLTMGEDGSDSGLIRSALEPNNNEPLYEIGDLVNSSSEGIRYRNNNGDVVFEVLNKSNSARIQNLDITGSLTSSNTVNIGNNNTAPVYEMDGSSIKMRGKGGDVAFKATGSGAEMQSLDVTGPITISGGNINIPSSNDGTFFFGNFDINTGRVNKTFSEKRIFASGPNNTEKDSGTDVKTFNSQSYNNFIITVNIFGSYSEEVRADVVTFDVEVKIYDNNGNVEYTESVSKSSGTDDITISEKPLPNGLQKVELIYDLEVRGGEILRGGAGVKEDTSARASVSGEVEVFRSLDQFVGPKGGVWTNNGNEKIRLDGVRGKVYVDGSQVHSSDARRKNNIQQVSDANKMLKSINGVTFEKDGERGAGVIAQDVIGIFDEVVDYYSINGYGINYNGLHALTIEAVKDHETRISKLENKLLQ